MGGQRIEEKENKKHKKVAVLGFPEEVKVEK